MEKAGLQINTTAAEVEDWDFLNDVSEAVTIAMAKLPLETEQADQDMKKKQVEEQNSGYGDDGKFGVQTDCIDTSAMGHDYNGEVEKHTSENDYSDELGGKFDIQKSNLDKSAVGWVHVQKFAKISNLRAKFENLAKNKEEETRKRVEEQKRLRDEKDQRDRDEAAINTIFENTPLPTQPIISDTFSYLVGNTKNFIAAIENA